MSTAARVEDKTAKHPSTLKMKTLKQGFRTVMTSNRMSKTKEKVETPDDSEDSDIDELNVDDLAPSARETAEEIEASMEFTESASALRASVQSKQPRGPHALQDSPRGPDEIQGATPASFQAQQSLVVGSDSNIHFHNSNNNQQTPLSPMPTLASDDGQKHPTSAPLPQGLSPVLSPARGAAAVGKNGKFLRGKIKISALKNFVGTGLDLGNNTTSSNSHATKQTPRGDAQELLDFLQEEVVAEDSAPQPVPAKGTGTKLARKMRNSILGFKNLTKANKNAPVLLDDDNTESTDFRFNEDANDTFSVEDSIPSASEIAQFTHENVDHVQPQVNTKESLLQEKIDAKQRRKEKHNQRRARHIDGDSTHAANALGALVESSEGLALQRKGTKTKLDSQARERLKKHSEGRDFRTGNRTANRRLRQQMLSKHSSEKDLNEQTKDESAAKASKALSKAPLVRTSSEPVTKRTESHIGRKVKDDGDKLRERVRTHHSFVSGNRPKKEPSLSVIEIMNDDDDDNVSTADDISSANSEEAEEDERSLTEGSASQHGSFKVEHSPKRSDQLAENQTHSGRSLKPSSAHSDGHEPLSCQHVESARSDDYLQLIIGDVPPKSASPPPPPDTDTDPPSPQAVRGKRLSRKPSRQRVMDSSSGRDSSQTRRSTKANLRGRSEKSEASARRKPRSERTNHHRHADRSPRRKSDNLGVCRRRAPNRSDPGHASEPVLNADSAPNENPNMDATMDTSNAGYGHVDVSSRSNLGKSSARTSEAGGDYNLNHDSSAQSNVDPNVEIGNDSEHAPSHAVLEASEMKDSSKRHEGKDNRRRHHKGSKDKDISRKLDRKISRGGLGGGTRHSAGTSSCSTSKTNGKLHRTRTTESNVTTESIRTSETSSSMKKAPSRGRSERRRESRSNPERLERKGTKNSIDTRKREESEGKPAEARPVASIRGESEGKSAEPRSNTRRHSVDAKKRGSSEGRVPAIKTDIRRHSVDAKKRGSNDSDEKSVKSDGRRHSVDAKKRGSNDSEGKSLEPASKSGMRRHSVDSKKRESVDGEVKEPEMVVSRETGTSNLSKIKW